MVPERGKHIRAYKQTQQNRRSIGHADDHFRCEPAEVGCNPPTRMFSADPRVVHGRLERVESARDFEGRTDSAGYRASLGV